MKQNQRLQQSKEQEKQFLDINTAPFTFPAKDLPKYFDISYVGALKLAHTENFGFRCGEKKLFIFRDKFITWMDQKCGEKR
jgi:hypothetical protein